MVIAVILWLAFSAGALLGWVVHARLMAAAVEVQLWTKESD